jgi:hypothetical protein
VEDEFREIVVHFPAFGQARDDRVQILRADIDQRIIGIDMDEEVSGLAGIGGSRSDIVKPWR